MKGNLTLEVLRPDGRVVRRTQQPSRSITVGFMKILYSSFAHTGWARQGYQAANLEALEHNLFMAAPHGRAIIPWRLGSYYESSWDFACPEFIGECFGIQISTDDTAVTPLDARLPLWIGQGRARWAYGRRYGSNRLYGICTDRYQYMWIVDDEPNKICKHYLCKEAVLDFATPGTYPRGLTYDGTYLWHVDDATTPVIYRLDPNDGSSTLNFNAPGTEATGLAWDFDNSVLWHCDKATDLIYKLDPADGTVLDSFAAPGGDPCGLEWFEGYLYNLDKTDRKIYKINPVGGAVVKTIPLPPVVDSGATSPQSPWGVMFDGLVWVISDNTSAGFLWGLYLPEDETEVVLGGMEIFVPTFSHPNGSMVLRRCFSNNSGGNVTIRKVGIHAGAIPELVAADVLGTPVTIADTQVLRASYTLGITV